MTKKDLIEGLQNIEADEVIVVGDDLGGWDNIVRISKVEGMTMIIFGGGSPFSSDK